MDDIRFVCADTNWFSVCICDVLVRSVRGRCVVQIWCFPIIGDSDEDSISSGASLNRTMLFLATPEFWSEKFVDLIILQWLQVRLRFLLGL